MDRGAWWAAVLGSQRVGHDLATNTHFGLSFYWTKLVSTFQSHSKASYEHQVPVKETIAFIAGYQAREWASLVAQMVKNLPAMPETSGRSLCRKEMATRSSILAWRIPWIEEPGELQSIGSQRIKCNWVTNTHTQLHGPRSMIDVIHKHYIPKNDEMIKNRPTKKIS